MTHARDEAGVALLVVLLAITLLTITVVEFTYSAQVETRLARGTRNALQAYYLARSGVNLAEAILIRDTQLTRDVDSELDVWAQPLPPLPLGDGTIMLRVRDEARFLNVNSLARAGLSELDTVSPERRAFKGIFALLGLDANVRAAMIDWLDPNERPEQTPPGAEQPFYLGLQPPVAVRNGPIVDLRELLAVRDMTPEMLSRLSNFVTVIPGGSDLELRVNVNTAPAEVLMALSPGLARDTAAVQELMQARTEAPFAGRSALRERAPRAEAILRADETLAGRELWDQVLTFGSRHFRIEAVGTVAGTARGITAVVRRTTGIAGRVTRVAWSPRVAQLALTTLPPSDFLEALPPLGGG